VFHCALIRRGGCTHLLHTVLFRRIKNPAEQFGAYPAQLDTSVDFLLNGKTDEKAKAMIKNNELLIQFKAVESMPDKDRNIISELISAFIAKRQLQQIIK
jgi:hypothetical protein